MNKWKLVAIVLLVVVLVEAGFLYLLLTEKPTPTPQPTPTPTPKSTLTPMPPPTSEPTPPPTTPIPQLGPPTPPPKEEVNLGEAEAILGIKIPVPSYMTGNLSLKKVEMQGETSVLLYYRGLNGEKKPGVGIQIVLVGTRNWADTLGGINSILRLIEKSGLMGWRITVNGYPGVAKEPGWVENPRQYTSGVVYLYTDTLEINIVGDYLASELIKVAESMPLTPIPTREMSLEEASALLNYTVLVPTYMVGNMTISKVEVTPIARRVELIYGPTTDPPYPKVNPTWWHEYTGVRIYVSPGRIKTTELLKHFVEQFVEAWLINVQGYHGIAREPGLLKSGYYAPGYILLYTENHMIEILGNYPTNELIKIAESMPLRG